MKTAAKALLISIVSWIPVNSYSQASLSTQARSYIESADSTTSYNLLTAFKADYRQAESSTQAQTKSELTPYILSILESPVSSGEVWNDGSSRRNKACVIAGICRVDQAITSLIEMLKPRPNQQVSARKIGLLDNRIGPYAFETPAIESLIEIGSSAKTPLEHELVKSAQQSLSLRDSLHNTDSTVSVTAKTLYRNEERKWSYIRYILKKIDTKD